MAEQLHWERKDSLEDVKIILAKILRKWYWVVIALAGALSIAILYIRYQDPIYVVKASFISKKFDERPNNMVSGLTGFGSLSERIEVNQQIPLLKSENRITETLNRLDFDVSYFVEGRLKVSEQYRSNPFRMVLLDSSSNIPYNQIIYISKIDNQTYSLQSSSEQLNRYLSDKTWLFNVNQYINGWRFYVSCEESNDINPNYKYYVIINHPRALMNAYRGKINLAWAYRQSSILNASIQSMIPEKDLDFMNMYLKVIVDLGLQEKNQYLVNTIDFINGYMDDVSDTILSYQNRIDKFLLANRDIINGSTIVIERLRQLDEEKARLQLENHYYNYIEAYIKNNKEGPVFAPNLIGIDTRPLQELVSRFMEEKWEDQLDKNEYNDKNPLLSRSNEEFERLEANIYESVKNLKQPNNEKIREIDRQINFLISSIDEHQVEYREYTNIERMKALYENLHDQLLAKRTDAYISRAAATSDYQMVTAPSYDKKPVYPDKNKIFLLAIVLGLGLPIGLILLLDLINPKVISKEDLKKHTDIPIIGSIGHHRGKTDLVVQEKPKSHISESFRMIRANLEYVGADSEGPKIILITSSISGEGKTFCAANLANTYANVGKRTLLIGADMRRPTLAKNFDLEQVHGLSNYLSGQDKLEDIIYSTNSAELDLIPGGHVPPNPAELLNSGRMTELMEYARQKYEVIVFDTPPLGIVADTIELIRHSFTPILVVRQGISYKKSLDAVTEMYHAGKLKNLGIIVNDVNFSRYDYGAYYGNNYGYGSGRGYGYYDEDQKKINNWRGLFHS